jgi:hypothetical protein
MPNEQIKVPLFAASEILTAANMNLSAGTGVPVFATTVTRDAAFGGAGEKVLAEGQLCYLSSTNVVQYYDGAAWATVGPSSGAGLVFLSAATFTAASTVSLPTNTFSATYQNYRISYNVTAASTDGTAINARLRASGTDSSAASYSNCGVTYQIGAATIGAANILGGTAWQFTNFNGSDRNEVVLEVYSPQLVLDTNFMWKTYGRVGGSQGGGNGSGEFRATTVFDSLTLFPSAGTITGNYQVYGYANA